MSSYSRSRLRLSLRVALGLSLAALFLSVAGLYFSESILCVENGTGKGDALVVLARIFHGGVEQRSGERVRRLINTEPNETATHRFFEDRL